MSNLRIPGELKEAILDAAKDDIEECLEVAEQSIPKSKMGEFKRAFYTKMAIRLNKDGIIAFKNSESYSEEIVNAMGYEWQGEEDEEEEVESEEGSEG